MRGEGKEDAGQVDGTIEARRMLPGAIAGALLHVARYCTCGHGTCDGTAGYKDRRKMRLGGKTRSAIRRRASRWPFQVSQVAR